MIYGVYAIRDVKMGFAQPILDQNDDSAIRNFRAQCLNANVNPTLFYTPEDFSIYRIGDYNTDTAELIPMVPNKLLAEAINFKKDGE